MNPLTNPAAYNTIRVGGRLWSSKVIVSGAAALYKWEKIAGQGTDGATSKFGGVELCDVQIKFLCWLPAHFDQFESEFRPLFQTAPKGKKPVALEVDSPELVKLGIRRVVVTKVGMLEAEGSDGLYSYPVDCSQFKPPKPVQVLKAKGADGGPDDPSTQLSPKQAMIKELTKLVKEEAAK